MRLGWVVLATALVAPAFAQTHGTPASVMSVGSAPEGRLVPNGVPASVTSLGPEGFTPGINPLFPSTGPLINPLQPSVQPVVRSGGHHRGGHRSAPVYYGYPVYYYSDSAYEQQPQQQMAEQQLAQPQPAQPQQLQIVLVDKRDEEKRAKENEEAVKAAAEPRQSNLSSPPADPAIFIFKDGTRRELANFAVMSGNLYDLSDGKMVKIALNTIDRDATLEANARAGREIQLP
jgi:hypothetical protein